MRKILFINSDSAKPRCAIFQAGKIYADAMRLCKEFELTYTEVYTGGETPDLEGYDAVIFNYQHVSMQIMPPAYFSYCPVAIGFLYEARLDPADSPVHFGGLKAGELFDILISPDPTLVSMSKVWAVPRVIQRWRGERIPQDITTISTFGFPSPWKDLKRVVEMMNEEFTEGIFRLNFSSASHQVDTDLQNMMIAIANELVFLAKPRIKILFTQEYMTDVGLVRWLSDSDLNVFLAKEERGIQTGGALLASADMAIAAQAPLLVSDNIEARHLKGCKWKSLKEAIMYGAGATKYLYDIWSPENFASKMDEFVREYL